MTARTFEVRDASGALVALHERTHRADGSKTFVWRQPDGTPGLGGVPVAELPLYGIERLDGMASAVVVVEGEACAEALWRLGIATVGTVTGAATAPGPAALADLGGRRVTLWPDADAPGRAHMATIKERLDGIAERVTVVEPPDGVPTGWDAADAIAEGRDIAALLAGPPVLSLAEALAGVERFLVRYVVFGSAEARDAVVLWVAHTHALDRAEATPYLGITSPAKQSGKTRLLECVGLVAFGCTGILIGPTAATIFRTLEATPGATLLLDELDAIFRDHSDKYEEVRAVINAGHRRGATVPRSVPGPKNSWVTKHFPVFGPKALAGIGKLPDTVADRSIPIRMAKRKQSEPIGRFRHRHAADEARRVVADLTRALAARPPELEADIPAGLSDRAGDGWEPLFAIADTAGEGWPTRARNAALILHANREQDDSLGLRLLTDVRVAFAEQGRDRLSTEDLIAALASDAEGPWADARNPLTAHRLSRLLRPFGIRSKQMRIDERSLKGYEQAAFVDAWERYLDPAQSPTEAKHRNTEHARGFDVSDVAPSETGTGTEADGAVEDDYPRSAWDPDDEGDDPQSSSWFAAPLAEPAEGSR